MPLFPTGIIRLYFIVLVLAAWTARGKEPSTIRFERDTVLSGDLLVPYGGTLELVPGITVQFSGYGSITVKGMLLAEGKPDAPIVITGRNRPRGSTGPVDWKGIYITGSDAYARLRHCRIEGAYRTMIWEARATIDSCTFCGNHAGLYCAKNARPEITRSTFFRNRYGIIVELAYPLLMNNVISDNTVGLYLQLTSEGILGRNTITNNRENVRVEHALAADSGSFSLHYLWNVMNQLY